MKHKFLLVTFVLMMALLLSACSAFGSIPQTGPSDSASAATVQAYIEQAAQATATAIAVNAQIAALQNQLTQVAAQPQSTVVSAETAVAPSATATQVPPTATLVPPTATQVPPTATPLPPTATPVPCNAVQFVKDVTIPDGTVLSPNSTFVKTWRLKNVGACTWTTAYSIVFVGGRALSAPAVVALPGSVVPGQVIDVSVTMVAPASEGSYRSEWKMRDAAGVLFGLSRADKTFFADIKVSAPTSKYPLDFVATMCSASWTSGAGNLNCPGTDNDARGFVLRVDNPILESGYKDNEPVLLTYPQMVNDGVIRGKYPSFRVESGHHFKAIIDCAYQTTGCDVNFQLDYQIGDGSIQNLKTWHEAYEGQYTNVDVDLSGLAGQDVKFILTVFANGSSANDRAQWLAPRIVK